MHLLFSVYNLFLKFIVFYFGIKLLMKVHFDTLLWNGVEWDYHTSERFKPRINPPFSTCLYLAGKWQLLSIRSISLNILFCHLFWVKWQLFHDFAEQIKYKGSTKVVSPGESIDLKYLPENKNMLDRCKYDTYERLEKSCIHVKIISYLHCVDMRCTIWYTILRLVLYIHMNIKWTCVLVMIQMR